jgi:desulfoferrodoxin (superoxide reductase-like protein)
MSRDKKCHEEPGMVAHTHMAHTPVLGCCKQEDHKIKVSVGYIARPWLRNKSVRKKYNME